MIMKKEIQAFDYAGQICKALPKGILMTTKNGDFVNTMVIGWGHIGIEWGRPIFVAYVRESRHTKQLLEEHGEFTVNIPTDNSHSKVLGYCGTKSGRDCDKIADMCLTLEAPNQISVPGIKEFPITLECRVIYKQKQNLDAIPSDILERFYPEEADGFRDCHIAYYGEIVDAYLIRDDM